MILRSLSSETQKRPKNKQNPSGFALVATVLLMVLLSILALGMLSLSTVSLRSSSKSSALAEARANAKLALIMAIERLQSELGPDQRISANGSIISEVSSDVIHPHWTGVWDSWLAGSGQAAGTSEPSEHSTINDQNSGMHPSYEPDREDHFRSWLVSLDPTNAADLLAGTREFDSGYLPTTDQNGIILVGQGSLPDPNSTDQWVEAPLVDLKSESDATKTVGRYGWWIGDESQKANIMEDSYESDQNLTTADLIFRQQAPGSTGTKSIQGLENITDEGQLSSVVSRRNIELIDEIGELAPSHFHDTTLNSRGVLADVREGGLKRDLSTILSQPIDPEDVYNTEDYFAYQRLGSMKSDGDDYMLYRFDSMVDSASVPGEATVPIQDLAAYYQLYDRYRPDWQQQGIQYSSSESTPPNNLLSNGIMISTPDFGVTNQENEKYLRGYTSLYRQVIPIKIEYILHYAARPIPPDPDNPTADTHELKIGFSPAITLWNPNNVPMVMNFGDPEDNALMIREHPMELGLTFQKSESYDADPVESKTMEFNRITNTQQGELYTVFISGNEPVVFEPGETKVFSLKFSSNTSPSGGLAEVDMAVRGRVGNRYAEPYIEDLELVPGWNPEKFLIPTTDAGGRRQQDYIFTFKDGDYISTRIAPSHGKTFSTDFAPKARHGRNKVGVQWVFRSWRVGGRIVEGNQYQRSQFHRDAINMGLPQTGEIAGVAEKSFLLPARSASSLIDGMQDPANPDDDLPQAFFYYGMKAGVETHESNQSFNSAGSARRFPSRPFTHSSALSPPMIDKLTGQDLYTHGWNWFFMGLDNYLDAPISISNDSNGYYGGGYTAENGTTHVVQQQLPLTPPISIATLSHAQLGGFSLAVEPPWVYDRFPPSNIRVEGYRRTTASGFDGLAPRTLQAIGNSYAHPNIPKDQAVKEWGRLSTRGWNSLTDHPEPYVDHSYLANKALWDEFYFSSIIAKPSDIPIFAGAGQTVEEVARDFFFEQAPLPNRRIIAYGDPLDEAKLEELLATRDEYRNGFADQIASHLMVDGPFNINSTSVNAWKALFSSLKNKSASYLDKDGAPTAGTDLQEFTPEGVP
ncbi:MAG: hypothetical protein AB8D78_00550, partial [Akkermansiaceae bacterium]